MKLLITGIPGTGKTSIGNFLESGRGYKHLDIENVFKTHGVPGLEIVEKFLAEKGENMVITWGFRTVEDEPLVRRLQSLGYKMIWFDGNREAARREFLKRGDVPEALFDLQLRKIDKMDLDSFKAMKVNTFDERGEFLSQGEIVGLMCIN